MSTSSHPLEDVSHLILEGPDAVRYLNGQVSNNVEQDLSKLVLPACLCTLKGKVEALVFVSQGASKDQLIIECQASQAEAVHMRLDRYLIADECELQLSESPVPVWYSLKDKFGLPTATPETLDYLTTIHGIPSFGAEITGEEFPAELGLDRWAVDFHKGCYLGQEIVSRIESVGKTKRILKLIETDQPLEAGYLFENDKGKTLAKVTRNSIADPQNEGIFLSLVLANRAWQPDEMTFRNIDFPGKRTA